MQFNAVQMTALRQGALGRFEDDMVVHLRGFAPRHCEVIGDAAVRAGVRLGVQRAGSQGFTQRGPLRCWVELMFMFGCDFDTDPQHGWARAVLQAGDGNTDPMVRAERLHEAAMRFTDATGGPGHRFARAALRRVNGVRYEQLPLCDGAGDLNFDATMAALLAQVHPEKAAHLAPGVLDSIVARGKALVVPLRLEPSRGSALCAAAAFALGHGFGHDPLLPWIERTVSERAMPDAATRTQRLFARMSTYLAHVVAAFDAPPPVAA